MTSGAATRLDSSGDNGGGAAAAPSETTSLLPHDPVSFGQSDHGTFGPRPASPVGGPSSRGPLLFLDGSELSASTSAAPSLLNVGAVGGGGGGGGGGGRSPDGWSTRLMRGIRSKKMSQSSALASRAGFEDSPLMYLAYYIPCLRWMRQYRLSFLKGDLIAAVTMASMYLPMALSLADNLAHVSPIHGIYSFVINPLVYALLGSCSAMVVGPEAPGSLLVGSVVKRVSDAADDDPVLQARVVGVVAGMAGATVLVAGLTRLGFLDNVLSRPFLRGFISAIGLVITVEQLIPEMGLVDLSEELGVSHGSAAEKIVFIAEYWREMHRLTFAIAIASFGTIMVFRALKRRLEPRYPSVAYFPDRFLVVVLSAILSRKLDWASRGVGILGALEMPAGGLFAFRWPFRLSHMGHIREALGTSFLIALLGFFESTVAAKSLGQAEAVGIQGMDPSANRELVALGVANLIGGCFMALPAFGGYGRSKVNRSTGGKTPMSSVFLSALSLLCACFLLPWFFYLPKPVLCSMISVVGWSLVEEAPHDVLFFGQIRAWAELGLMALIFFATLFYSLTVGMAIGVGVSILRVVHHATRSRIQILGRVPGTNKFENAELGFHHALSGSHSAEDLTEEDLDRARERLEFIEGCLIVKIPEPLTFANTGELKGRLRRLERYGTSAAHPALPHLRAEDSNRNVIFDIHGVTSLDGAGTQVLEEIVRGYRQRGVRVFFSRGPWPKVLPPSAAEPGAARAGGSSSCGGGAETLRQQHPVWVLMERAGIVELIGGEGHFVGDVQDALKLVEERDGGEGQ